MIVGCLGVPHSFLTNKRIPELEPDLTELNPENYFQKLNRHFKTIMITYTIEKPDGRWRFFFYFIDTQIRVRLLRVIADGL